MRRMIAAAVLGVLALVFAATLDTDRRGPLGLFAPDEPVRLYNVNTGRPLTLETIQRDIEWHRETAEKLRRRPESQK